MPQTRYPFEVPFDEVERNPDPFIDTVVRTLESSFMVLPRGPGFVSYPRFQEAYEVLKRHTRAFTSIDPGLVMDAISEDALVFVVLRTILGFTAPELAYRASVTPGVSISQGYARSFDRRVRDNRRALDTITSLGKERVAAMVATTCALVERGKPDVSSDMIHRMDKADTGSGTASLRHVAHEGVPYTMLLYERFLGRPFAAHRDSVSGLVGAVMENAVERELREAGISFRETGRAERIEGFDQMPDFMVPDEWNPRIVIEAKITEDDGTARDKVTRIQHLAAIAQQRVLEGESGFEVIACIDGRGFGVRREDMRKLLEATQGNVFTLQTIDRMVQNTGLRAFETA